MKLSSKIAAAALAVLAGACGRESSSQGTAEAVSCSIRVPANPDAIQAALKDVRDGSLDPCAGAIAHPDRYLAELTRIDPADGGDAFVEMVFAMRQRHPGDPVPVRP